MFKAILKNVLQTRFTASFRHKNTLIGAAPEFPPTPKNPPKEGIPFKRQHWSLICVALRSRTDHLFSVDCCIS